jgi:ADP-heptose:LPS heptosyltransferase
MFETIRWIRRQHFARIYDLQSNDRSALLCTMSGAPMRIGNHPRYPYTHHPPTPHLREEHGFGRLQLMLAAAGLPLAEEKPYLPVSEAERMQVGAWIQKHGLSAAPFAVMHAGASPRWPAKRWPHYGELAARVEKCGLRVVWLGASSDALVNAELAQRAGIDATDEFSIPALAELARHARFAVTNDSAPMHALAAAGIPIYAFFGPTDWRRSHALGQRERVLFNPEPCTACARADRATATDHICLPGISVERVMERLQRDGVL